MLSVDKLVKQSWDVVVVGAGPAGAVAARQIALQGASVLLVDKAPLGRWKVCGCCLNGSSLAMLEVVSLGELTTQCGAVPLARIQLAARGCEAAIPLTNSVSLSRCVLDAALVEAGTASGVHFLAETHATPGKLTDDHCEIVLTSAGNQFSVRTKLVLAADGLGSKLLARRNDFSARAEPDSRIGGGIVLQTSPSFIKPGTIFMACAPEGYVGMVILEDGRLNVAAAFDRVALLHCGGPGPAAARILAEVGWPPIEGLEDRSWRGTAALTRQASTLSCERVLVLGDAAGYVEPFTGEGIAWALGSAIAITPLALRAVERWDAAIGQEWSQVVRETVRTRQGLCRALAWGLRHPALTRSVISVLHYAPGLAVPFLRRLNAPHNQLLRPQP